MRLIVGDRATFKLNDTAIPVNDIVIVTAKQWLRDNLRFINPDEHVKYQVELRPASAGLQDIFNRGNGVFVATIHLLQSVTHRSLTQRV